MTERIIRNFKLLEQVGTGMTGVIHRAIQTTLDRPVAVKELHPHLAKDRDFIQRFEREAKAAATLQHENIVGVIDYGQEADCYFIALEFIDGGDLQSLLTTEPKVITPVAVAIMSGMLRGLEHAHSRKIVHRDIKPANVMLTHEGTVKIADFSIAQASLLPSMTVTGAMMGTPAYMSPEQVAGRPLDPRTDLFSAGAILFEMLSGKRPFEGDTYPAMISNLLTVVPPLLSDVDPLIPVPIAAVVRKSLEKDPDKRYPTATAFLQELERAASASEIPIDRGLVAAFVADPHGAQETYRVRQATENFQRGLYLRTQGQSHIEEAIRALDVAVRLDPANAEAQRHLNELRKKRPAGGATIPRARNRWISIVPVAIALGAIGYFGLKFSQSGTDGVAATPTVETIAPATTAQAGGTHAAGTAPEPGGTPVATPTKLAAIPKTKTGAVQIAAVPWAKVYVDGKYLDTTPIAEPVKLEVGIHKIRFETPGYRTQEQTVHVKQGNLAEITGRMKSADATLLNLKATPYADVYVDGDHIGPTPITAYELMPGKHTIVLRKTHCTEVTWPVEALPGKTLDQSFVLTCEKSK